MLINNILIPVGQDLIKKLLTVDPQQRLTAEQSLAHPWIASTLSESASLKSLPSVVGLKQLFGSKFKVIIISTMKLKR